MSASLNAAHDSAARPLADSLRASGPCHTEPVDRSASPQRELIELRDRIDDVVHEHLRARREEIGWIDPEAIEPIDEVTRILDAGGKRLRPIFCYWGHRAAGGADGEPILRVSAAFELLHTMALIHDDVMDESAWRRDQASSHVHLASVAGGRGLVDADRVGRAGAILAGDLAAVLADMLFLASGFPPERLVAALARYDRMRVEMAVGQHLDLIGAERDPRRLAGLKGGAYTVRGPLLVGATLASADGPTIDALERFGDPLGQAFQLYDDLRDGDAASGITASDAAALVADAKRALEPSVLEPAAVDALGALADLVAAT
jgi:geranylgeranyl diphosphate synthase type I